jgi:hypothetical protein
MRFMTETRCPNRWFGSNPQAISSQGRKLSAFPHDLPKDWRSALGLGDASAANDASEPTASD